MLELHRRPAATPGVAPRAADRVELGVLAAAFLGVVVFYAGAFWVRGFGAPVGDDSFFYVSAIRIAGRLGLATSHLASRPAYPLVGSIVGSVVRSSPWTTAVALPFAVAAGAAAAGAALAARWSVRRWALGGFLVTAGVSVVVGRLVAGRSENLMNVWLLAAALAVWVWSSGRTRLAGTGLLLFVAGLTEWPFLAAFMAILGSAVVGERVAARGRRTGTSPLSELVAVSVAAAAGVALVVFAVNGTVPGDAVQRLPPAGRYRPFLMETLRTYMPLLTVPAIAVGWLASRRDGPPRVRATRWLLGTWLAVTGVVVVAGVLGLALPTYRALTFALPVALATAAAPLLPGRLAVESRRDRRPAWIAVTAVIAAAALVPGALMWYRSFRPRTNSGELGQISAVARYAATLSPGTTVVVTYGQPDLLKALYYEGVFDAFLPAALRGRVQVFPGTAEKALAGSVPSVVDPDARATAHDLFEDVAGPLATGAPVVALRALDRSGFSQGLVRSDPLIGEGAIVVRGPPPTPTSELPGPIVPLPEGGALLLWSVAMLLVLAVAGVGWSALILPPAPAAVRLALAPAFGAVALTLLGLGAVTAGLTVAGWVGPGIVGVSVVASLAAAWWSPRPPRTV